MATGFSPNPISYVHPEAYAFRNIQYRPHLQCRLNVYQNVTPWTGGNPVLVYTHGGGWGSNDKTTTVESTAQKQKLLFAYLLDSANYGTDAPPFSVVSVEYRMHAMTNIAPGPLNTPYERTTEGTNPGTGGNTYPTYFPHFIDDVQAAVQWVKDNADLFGFNASKVALFGTSAGGMIALNAAFAPQRAYTPAHTRGSTRFSAHSSSRVRGVMHYYGQFDFDPWYYDYTLTAPALGVVGNDTRQRAQMERLLLKPDASGLFPEGSEPTDLARAVGAKHLIEAQSPPNAGMRVCSWYSTFDDGGTLAGYAARPPWGFHDYQQFDDIEAIVTGAGYQHAGAVLVAASFGGDVQLTWESSLAPSYEWLTELMDF